MYLYRLISGLPSQSKWENSTRYENNIYLNLHAKTVTEIAKFRRQSIMVHSKTQDSKELNSVNICQKVRTVLSSAIPVVIIQIYQSNNQLRWTRKWIKFQLRAFWDLFWDNWHRHWVFIDHVSENIH
jgi:hypothetical protein